MTRGQSRPSDAVRPGTRQRYLEIAAGLRGVDSATEPAYAHIAGSVKLTEVAERLGVPRSRLYREWQTQHDYWRDLVLHMVAAHDERWIPAARLGDIDGPLPLDQAFERARTAGAAVQEQYVRDPRHTLRIALLGYPPVPGLAEHLLGWERGERRRIAHDVSRTLRATGRVVRPPLTTDDLAAAVWSMVDGVGHLAHVSSDFADTRITLEGGRPWTLLAYALRAVVFELTEPGVPTADDVVPPEPAPSRGDRPEPARTPLQARAIAEGVVLYGERVTGAAPDRDGTAPSELPALGHVTLARVARAAGVTRRQLYHLWSSHDEFRADLLAHLRAAEGARHRRALDEGLALALERRRAGHLLLDVAEHLHQQRVRSTARFGPPSRFTFAPHLGHPAVQRQARHDLARVLDLHRQRLGEALARTGIELRPGLTARHLDQLVIAALQGAEVLWTSDPSAARPDLAYRGGRYSLFAIACQALLDHSRA